MKKHSKALLYAAIIGLIIVAIFLGFLSGMDNPISWILILALLLTPFIYNKTKSDTQLIWKEEYSVGIEVLDLDHKKLINLLNQFSTAYDYAMSEEFERQALDDLVDYTKYHFEREEKILIDHEYPDFDEHKKQHQDMINRITHIQNRYNEKGHEVFEEVSEFLTNWLITHINGTDKQYTQHLIERGYK